MGIRIDRDRFDDSDHALFEARLEECLSVLSLLLARADFGEGERTLGAEIELSLVDAQGAALPLNRAVLAESLDPHVQLELDRFNLEYNLTPVPARGRPFSAFEREIELAVHVLDAAARPHGGSVIPIGILPTLSRGDLEAHAMTDLPRYRALSSGLRALRAAPFAIRIDGPEPLSTAIDDVTMEGATTSLQLHLRVSPREFAAVYNAAQLATAPLLAAASNSPLFLGRRLWRETRIALFKQAVDSRVLDQQQVRFPARVSFGEGWVRRGAYELFAETVALFPPLIPIAHAVSAREQLQAGEVPELAELRLHSGTVWRWNRAVYDAASGGHLRIELRALPAGPSALDGAANAALAVGLALGLSDDIDRVIDGFPFAYAHRNFYRAAKDGLSARLLWPRPGRAPRVQEVEAGELVVALLPRAQAGLCAAGVEPDEARRMLDVIRARVGARQTGADYQLALLSKLERSMPRARALQELTLRYMSEAKGRRPVHSWSTEP